MGAVGATWKASFGVGESLGRHGCERGEAGDLVSEGGENLLDSSGFVTGWVYWRQMERMPCAGRGDAILHGCPTGRGCAKIAMHGGYVE